MSYKYDYISATLGVLQTYWEVPYSISGVSTAPEDFLVLIRHALRNGLSTVEAAEMIARRKSYVPVVSLAELRTCVADLALRVNRADLLDTSRQTLDKLGIVVKEMA